MGVAFVTGILTQAQAASLGCRQSCLRACRSPFTGNVWRANVSLSDVPREILNLSVADRLELVTKIWDSIVDDGLPPMTQAQRDLIDERIAEADSGPQSRIPAAEVFGALRQLD